MFKKIKVLISYSFLFIFIIGCNKIDRNIKSHFNKFILVNNLKDYKINHIKTDTVFKQNLLLIKKSKYLAYLMEENKKSNESIEKHKIVLKKIATANYKTNYYGEQVFEISDDYFKKTQPIFPYYIIRGKNRKEIIQKLESNIQTDEENLKQNSILIPKMEKELELMKNKPLNKELISSFHSLVYIKGMEPTGVKNILYEVFLDSNAEIQTVIKR